jgi:DNA-binding response OmpR family regulator
MPHRIFVVDDEPQIQDFLSRALRQAGYEVIAMNDGLAGLEAATSAELPYDLVVTNNCMPRLSAAEMVARIRDKFPDMPILHLDDLSQPHDPRYRKMYPTSPSPSAWIACSPR